MSHCWWCVQQKRHDVRWKNIAGLVKSRSLLEEDWSRHSGVCWHTSRIPLMLSWTSRTVSRDTGCHTSWAVWPQGVVEDSSLARRWTFSNLVDREGGVDHPKYLNGWLLTSPTRVECWFKPLSLCPLVFRWDLSSSGPRFAALRFRLSPRWQWFYFSRWLELHVLGRSRQCSLRYVGGHLPREGLQSHVCETRFQRRIGDYSSILTT